MHQKEGYFIVENWTTEMVFWLVENTPSFNIDNKYINESEPLMIEISFTDEIDETAFKLKWL